MYKGPMDKNRMGGDGMWEVGVGRTWESNGRKMGTIVIVQQ